MININILNIIESIREKDVYTYLNGECYIFAKKLRDKIGGKLRYLLIEHHFVVEVNGKLYDASGNVTSAYRNSKYITEEEFNSRKKLVKGIKKR